jgi:hypothetical protein
MTRSEIALLLGYIAARDRRTVGETDVLAWHEDLGDLDAPDTREAVRRHFRESTDYLMPAHIRRLVRLIRDERRKGNVIKALRSVPQNPEGAQRVRQLLAEMAAKRAVPGLDAAPEVLTRSQSIHERALARARAERRGARA